MNKLRIAIIGTGGISNSHVRAYQKMDDIEIVDTPELDLYIDDYLRRYRPSSRE